MTTTNKAPGLFQTIKLMLAGSSGAIIQTARTVEDTAKTGRLMLIEAQAEALASAQEALKEANLSFDEFQALRENLLK
jgi:hypothetical protein